MNYIKSVHRPYNSRLKSVRWVCEFTEKHKTCPKSEYLFRFYLYIIERLYRVYDCQHDEDSYGLPSYDAIRKVRTELMGLSIDDKIKIVKLALDEPNKTAIDKVIFSTYKAASFYTTLARQFGLINNTNQLTKKGEELLKIRSSRKISLSAKERVFFLEIITQKDFVQFILQVYLNKVQHDSNLPSNEMVNLCVKFLSKYYPALSSIGFKTKSIRNFMIVKSQWIEDLDIITKSRSLKPSAVKTIRSALPDASQYDDFHNNFTEFQKQEIKPYLEYQKVKKAFIEIYRGIKNDMQIPGFDYINLYDIMNRLGMSYNRFQKFLDKFSADKEYIYRAHFQNIVRSIDGRPRFTVKDVQVISIRIDGV